MIVVRANHTVQRFAHLARRLPRPPVRVCFHVVLADYSCNTFLFFLQNDWGADTWPVSAANLAALQTELESEARVLAGRNF